MTQHEQGSNEGIDMTHERMAKEHAALMLQRARLAAILGLSIYPIFGISDWIDYHSIFPLELRLFTTLVILAAFIMSRTKGGSHHPFSLASICFIAVAVSLAIIMWRQHDVKGYTDGFEMLILAFCGLIPARTAQSAICCSIIVAIFLGTGMFSLGSSTLELLGPQVIALVCVTVICLVIRHVANRLWEREFISRQQLREALEELRATQTQLVEAEKMSALGRLVAGVAHEMNNSLSVIASNLSPLERAMNALLNREDHPENDATRTTRDTMTYSIKLLHRGVERAAKIIQNLRKYSTRSQGQHSLADANEIVELSVSLIATQAKEKDVTIHCEYGDVSPIKADSQSLSQVLVNVLTNAFDAVPESGNIWVRTDMLSNGNRPSGLAGSQSTIVIIVRDDGPGIPAENLAKLFDPFFTTKPPGAGMGLGLGIARRIIEDHHGAIEIANYARGALVSIKLPADPSY
jgi:C4-dicarboxylate-specific signal transduction histidine kinase